MNTKLPLTFYGEPLPGVDITELQGKLIVIEGPDAVGRSTQVARLKAWLERRGHAVLDTGMARSMLAGEGIQQAKLGHTFGRQTMTLFYATDFADRLENEIVPALRAGFVVLTDRYIFSIIARAAARGEDRLWIESVVSFALVPHVVYYMRAETSDLVQRVVVGKGAFDYWESGMDTGLGHDMFESFVHYQTQILRALDGMAERYWFITVNASRSPDEIFADLQASIGKLFTEAEEVVVSPALPAVD
jgi:dTMP kinase